MARLPSATTSSPTRAMGRHGRWRPWIVAVLCSVLAPTGATAATCWRPPVDAPVADPFRAPACRWCPGNRGIEYDTAPGQRVRAVAGGTVAFAGVVAGARYVVVRHADGRRATYGRLATARPTEGDVVVAGATIGTTGERFHFGLRDDDGYLDPAPLLGELVRRARLVPIDGGRGNPAPPPVLRCRRSGVASGRAAR